jgi:CheY-like chemotaxis protein
MHISMALTSLLVCADAEAVQVLSRIFQDLNIEVETCGDPHAAQIRIDEQRFDALVVDCQDETVAAALIGHARNSVSHHSSTIIALVNTRNQAQDILARGATFLLYKPVSRERALHSIYAARALIRQERRGQPRIPVHASASVAYPGKEDAAATIVELNENGLGIRTTDPLPPSGKVYFQFALPGQESVIRLAGEVMWRNAAGRIGIRFVNVPQASKRVLQRWVREQSASGTKDQSLSKTAQTTNVSVRLSAGLGLLSASAPDRRNLSRRACCLGAEVYPADSKVPHRCTLSDISSGGCYVETTEPFPAGTILTIVVRTHELKLCVSGKVQSTHPGFGMGVRFDLTTDDERAQVQELIACAQAEPKLTL